MNLSALKRILFGGVLGSSIAIGFAQAGTQLHLQLGTFKPGIINQDHSKFSLGNEGHALQTNYFIIQFKDKISQSLRDEFQAAGIRIHRYIPDDALLVSGDKEGLVEFAAARSGAINGVVPYLPSFKLSQDLEPLSVITGQKMTQVIVQLFDEGDLTETQSQIEGLGLKVEAASGKFLALELASGMIPKVAALDGVEHIQPYVEMEPMHIVLTEEDSSLIDESVKPKGDYTDVTGYETGTKLMNFEAAWQQGLTGRGQRVGVADTGLDSGEIASVHKDFSGMIHSGYTYGMFASNWKDTIGHGTHVAGSVLGNGQASTGHFRGGAYEAQLVVQGMWSPLLRNLTVPTQLRDMFSKAYSDGARVHTNSWGSGRNLGAYDGYAQQVDEFMWEHPEMLIIFASGNSGSDSDFDGRVDEGSVSSPGTAKNTLTVGASENLVEVGGIQVPIRELNGAEMMWPAEPLASDYVSDNDRGIAMFSSRGPTLDGRLKPEVVAPGTNILSVMSQSEGAELMWGAYNTDYVYSGGTSMSTPLVAGAAAVARQLLEEKLQITSPSSALVKAVLMNTAFDLFPGQFGLVGEENGQEMLIPRPNMQQGFGRVDMQKLVELQNGALLVDERQGLKQGEIFEHNLVVSKNAKVAINLVYTDAPASPSSAKALVNDLDLELVDESGQVVLESSESRINNHEFIEADLLAGSYKIRVKAHNVPQGRNQGRQDFALVASQN